MTSFSQMLFLFFLLASKPLPFSYPSLFFVVLVSKLKQKAPPLALVAFLQSFHAPVKRCSIPKLVSLLLTNLTHQSSMRTSHPHFLLTLCPFAPLLFELCCQGQEPICDWYLQLGAQSLADLSVFFPVVPSSVA